MACKELRGCGDSILMGGSVLECVPTKHFQLSWATEVPHILPESCSNNARICKHSAMSISLSASCFLAKSKVYVEDLNSR